MKDRKSGKSSRGSEKASEGSLLERSLSGMLEGAVGLSGRAFKYAANSGLVSEAILKSPERLELMGKAGRALKDMRTTAGLSVEELSSIIDLENPDLLRAVEEGKTALPMDVMMRLASYYSRNDPLPFIIRFSRTYHPWLTQFFSVTGIDRLMVQAERELKFLKIYRNVDDARELSDDDFEEVLAFTRKAFNMALHFASQRAEASTDEEAAGATKKADDGGSAASKKDEKSPARGGGIAKPKASKAGSSKPTPSTAGRRAKPASPPEE